jgi:hypothetical protein
MSAELFTKKKSRDKQAFLQQVFQNVVLHARFSGVFRGVVRASTAASPVSGSISTIPLALSRSVAVANDPSLALCLTVTGALAPTSSPPTATSAPPRRSAAALGISSRGTDPHRTFITAPRSGPGMSK